MEALFSYGTLQQQAVQLDTFGKELIGEADTLAGFTIGEVEITDAAVLKSSGQRFHPILRYSGNLSDRVSGTIFLVTHDELKQADNYEVDDYKRVLLTFVSGKQAWCYIDAQAVLP